MRWSLFLFTCFIFQLALTLCSLALVIPETEELVVRRRGRARKAPTKIKDHSSNTRDKGLEGSEYWDIGEKGIESKPISGLGTDADKKAMIKDKDADHLLESQVVEKALRDQGKTFQSLDPNTRTEINKIMNSKENIRFVPKRINRSKGQVFKNALKHRKSVKTKDADRDKYIHETLPQAKDVAKKVDDALKKGGYKGNVFQTLMGAVKSIGQRK
ncbi:hypothetical protein NLJ89_g993 [Agrocybe chaxingu]|uniref:RxLR effector protein n=1 Tax=Agrocybe chaxingu TaxID=84603 RepID=A0A9W8N0U5_9AGAR|nr:hypothetical protein NLJ89_g993 [Agrocybe chaxingu]